MRSALRHVLAVGAVLGGWFALVAGSGGCELAIGGTVGAYQCIPGTVSCPAQQVCDPTVHQCVPLCTPTSCRAGTTCDASSNLCVPADASVADTGMPDTFVAPDTGSPDTSMPMPDSGMDSSMMPETAPIEAGPCTGTTGLATGCPCTKNSACASQICADSLTVTAGLYNVSGSFCTQPCCTSADCDANTVCFGTGQGGDYCVDPTWIGRDSGLGANGGGATCSTGRDCRSGLCGSGSTCVDTCCSAHGSQCAGGQRCEFASFAGAVAIDQNYTASCVTGGGQNGACRNNADCTTSGDYCGYQLFTTQPTTPTPVGATCFPNAGNLAEGATCDPQNDQCSGFCSQTNKVCTSICFTNADCAGLGVTGWRCRPETASPQGGGSYSVLACGP